MSDMQKLESARLELGQAMAKTMDLYGFTTTSGMLYSLLYFSEEPRCLDDLSAEMGVSKTTICNGVRSMEDRGLLYKTWRKGSRRDFYDADTNFFTNFINYFASMWQRELDVNSRAIKKAEPVIRELVHSSDSEVREKATADLEKIAEAKQYYGWLEKMVRALESGEIFDLIPVNGESAAEKTKKSEPGANNANSTVNSVEGRIRRSEEEE